MLPHNKIIFLQLPFCMRLAYDALILKVRFNIITTPGNCSDLDIKLLSPQIIVYWCKSLVKLQGVRRIVLKTI